jgi:hypothetical protein
MWPDGIEAIQEAEIKLAFYAGMVAMFSIMSDLAESHDDEDAAASDLGTFVEALQTEALRLSSERWTA